MGEEKTKLKKYWAEQAVSLALQGRWGEAVTANRNILALFPSDAEAHNRLGKAYAELGKYDSARESYTQALQIDPNNSIAEKNLQRLAMLVTASADAQAKPAPTTLERIDPQLFVEEMGKTGVTTIIHPAALSVLARQSAGDPVRLNIENRTLFVDSLRGERLGVIEPKLGHRLITFMTAGNRYIAAISGLDTSLRLIIRETFQHPSMAGRVSFPIKGGGSGFRSYIKDSVLKYDLDDDDDGAEYDREAAVETEVAGDEPSDEPESFDDDMNSSPGDDK